MDTTEHAETARRLQEHQRLLAKAMVVGQMGAWWSDPSEHGALVWSESTFAIFGLRPELFDGRVETFFNLVHPDDRELVREASSAAIRGDAPYDVTHRIVRPDGEVRWLHEAADIVRDEHGAPAQIIGVCHDITERKASDDALRESEERFSQFADRAQEAFWFAELSPLRLVYINPAGEKIWEMSAQELYANPNAWGRATHPDDRALAESEIGELVSGRIERVDVEFRLLRADSSVRWVHVRGTRIGPGPTGKPRIAGITEDITDRKMHEQQQRMLMDELDHRVKNNLASVLAVAQQTMRSCRTLEEFNPAFMGRIEAMARTHGLLAASGWEGADMMQMVQATLSAYETGNGRIVISGPRRRLPRAAAQPLCLALHELATNAAKYGALSSGSGTLRVEWRFGESERDKESLFLEWKERGGPAITAPIQRGFGTGFIEGVVRHELRGEAKLEFEPRGLSCSIRVPVHVLAAQAGQEGSAP